LQLQPVEGSAAGQLDIAERVDARVKQPTDDDRCLVFDDGRGAGDQGGRAQFAQLVDGHFDESAGFGVEARTLVDKI